MSDEKKEKTTPETPEEEKVDGDWKWDAAVPETKTDDISLDDLTFTPEKDDKAAEEEKEEKADKKSEEKDEPKDEKKEDKAEKESSEKKNDKKPEKEKKNKNKDNKETKGEKDFKKEGNNGCCVICGKPRKNSGSDLYCPECARKFLRTHFGIPQVLLAFVTIFFAIFGYITCASNIRISTLLAEAIYYYEDARYLDASNAIVKYSEEVQLLDNELDEFVGFFNTDPSRKPVDFFKDGELSNRILFETAIESFKISDSQVTSYINMINAYYVDGIPKSKKYDKIRNMYEFCLGVRNYAKTVGNEWYDFMYTDEATSKQMIHYEEAVAYLDNIPAKTPAEKASQAYLRLIAESIAEKDVADSYKILDNLEKEIGPEFSYMFDQIYLQIAWGNEDYDKCVEVGDRMYKRNKNDIEGYYYAIKANIMQGNIDAADERCEVMLKNNPEDVNYYSVKAEVLRRKGDFEGSVEICRQGIAVVMDAQIYNEQAISYMLLDKKEEALEAAKSAYELAIQVVQSNEVSLEIINTSALIAFLCGDSETYESIVELCTELQYELEEDVNLCIKGEKTFEEIYMEGFGDV